MAIPKGDIPVGTKIGKWTISGRATRAEYITSRPIAYPLTCECGTKRILPASKIRSGRSLSCGCGRPAILTIKNGKHGGTGTRLHRIWKAMRQRCQLPSHSCYGAYGGRGIYVADEWNDFVTFREWAVSHGYCDNLTIDRVDGKGNYEPSNCRWATYTQQANNISTNRMLDAFGEQKTLSEWARDERCAVSYFGLKNRVSNGWAIEQAVTTPPHAVKHPNGSSPRYEKDQARYRAKKAGGP